MAMMKPRLSSPREYEQLSAYLDGQLSPKEVARLRARLQADPQMQTTLEELRLTRVALHSLPMLRAPRNFTLTRQMVGLRQPAHRPAYPAFGFASLVTSLLLVFVLIADRTGFVSTTQTASLQATQVEYAVQTMVVEGLAQKEAAAPEAESMQADTPLLAEALSEESSPLIEALTQSLPYPEPTQEALLKAAPTEVLTATPDSAEETDISLSMIITPTEVVTATQLWGIGGGPPAVTPTLELEATLLPTGTPEPTGILDSLPRATETVPPLSDAAQMKLASSETPLVPGVEQPATLETPSPTPSLVPIRSVFLVAEIGLAVLAVLSALIFIYLYRKSS
jgi:negative regulator of sigma E activity